MRLINRSIIVTGGANGIGRHYAISLANQGAQVLIADLDLNAAQQVAESFNDIAKRQAMVACQVDVSSPSDVEKMVASAVDNFGRIDVLVNNAGVYPHVDFVDITYEEWRRVMTLNLDSVFLCCHSVLPVMRDQQQGKIINVATNLVWVGLPSMVHYIASKAGVIGFTKSLAREIGHLGITVNAIAPGAVIPDANFTEESKKRVAQIVQNQCVKRRLEPDDLVGTVVFLASDDSNFMSGQVITVDGGLTAH